MMLTERARQFTTQVTCENKKQHPPSNLLSSGKPEKFFFVSGSAQSAPLPPVASCSLYLKTLSLRPLVTCNHSGLSKWSCEIGLGNLLSLSAHLQGTRTHTSGPRGLPQLALLVHGNGLFVAVGYLLKETLTLQHENCQRSDIFAGK